MNQFTYYSFDLRNDRRSGQAGRRNAQFQIRRESRFPAFLLRHFYNFARVHNTLAVKGDENVLAVIIQLFGQNGFQSVPDVDDL